MSVQTSCAPLSVTTPLSERWQRVAIQQAAGIAQSWRTNRAQAYQDYVDDLLDYHEQQAEGTLDADEQASGMEDTKRLAVVQPLAQFVRQRA